ncbi:Phosphotransferase involved in threonylcarbamoyladenosine t(6)A37 formation in tRNA [hydrothermal vent metagenome]|uniref:Phosphotransferase involved in threonylcarbamoyladenosine t(6)A37 formation in tRNA n=1 Tax=hydrothermal vent metagenome TaxID=652676 RepID=A0A3B0VK71_9ZZZZ
MERKQALLIWVRKILADPECYIRSASSDASFRSYWRVFSQLETYIVMDAPPVHENCQPFIDISQKLDDCGIQVPKVIAQDLNQGFLLIADLGTVQYLNILNQDNYIHLYNDAIKALHIMQQDVSKDNVPLYDRALLQQELNLFEQWFITKHLDVELNNNQQTVLQQCHNLLIDNAQQQPQTFVHRDYHSRNLMKTKNNNPGVLDFQDAVIGPITYDLVSLLRDCYITWDESVVSSLSNQFRETYNRLNQSNINSLQWQKWFDLMGMQRHLKATGIFCRLNYRDNKSSYLKDINRTLCYVKNIAGKYPEFQQFANLIQQIMPSMEALCEQ